jgi:hypothetical protein
MLIVCAIESRSAHIAAYRHNRLIQRGSDSGVLTIKRLTKKPFFMYLLNFN